MLLCLIKQHTSKAHGESRSISPYIHNLGTRYTTFYIGLHKMHIKFTCILCKKNLYASYVILCKKKLCILSFLSIVYIQIKKQ
jgi:hypothetical protein